MIVNVIHFLFYISDCVKFHFQRSGVITSVGYGTDSYEPNIDCIHVIKPPKAIYKIEIVDLQMADSGDYIQVSLILKYSVKYRYF